MNNFLLQSRFPHVERLGVEATVFIYSPRGRRLHRCGTRAANEPIGGVWTLDEGIWSIGMCNSSKENRRPREKRVSMSLSTTYRVRRNPVIHSEKPATVWRGMYVVRFKL